MKAIHTDKAPAAIGPYSQAIEAGSCVYISGQIPYTADGKLAGESIEEQTLQSVLNVGEILKSAGCGFENVVKTTCYLADMADFGAFNAIYAEYFTGKPARACVAVKTLPKNVLVEIEAIAVKE